MQFISSLHLLAFPYVRQPVTVLGVKMWCLFCPRPTIGSSIFLLLPHKALATLAAFHGKTWRFSRKKEKLVWYRQESERVWFYLFLYASPLKLFNLKKNWKLKSLDKGWANIYCKRPARKSVAFVGHMVCYNYLTLVRVWKQSQTISTWAWLCSNKTFFTKQVVGQIWF